MHFVEKEPSQKRIDFAEKLKSNKILRVPGAYNPVSISTIVGKFVTLEIK